MESPHQSATTTPPTPKTRPTPLHPRAAPSAPTESSQSAPAAQRRAAHRHKTILSPTRSPQAKDKCNSHARFHAHGPRPSPSSTSSRRPSKRNTLCGPSSRSIPESIPHSQSLHRPPFETQAVPPATLETAPSHSPSSPYPNLLHWFLPRSPRVAPQRCSLAHSSHQIS